MAGAGHEAAFTAIVLRHRGHLLRHTRGVLRDQRAEDAVQQTFVRALEALRSGTEVRELRPWLHRIAHNVALTELTSGKRADVELREDWEDQSRSEEADRRVAAKEALVAVGALPERQRAALVRSAAGDPPDRIAQDLGISSVAARQLLHRARVNVRAAVRVLVPPPVVWMVRRVTTVWERTPRGISAGAAPVVSKVAVAVLATASVAGPATVIPAILSHPSPRSHHAERLAERPRAPRVAVLAPVLTSPSPSSPPVARPAHSSRSASPPAKVTSPASPRAVRSSAGAAVSASSPNSPAIGTGGSAGGGSAGAPVASTASVSAAGGANGASSGASGSAPTATATASSPPPGTADASSTGPPTASAAAASNPAAGGSSDTSGGDPSGSSPTP